MDDAGFSAERAAIGRRGEVRIGDFLMPFSELVRRAYFNRVSLSATGYYRTPKIHYDRASHTGRPFFYYAYGAAVSEVILDTLTGENRVLRTDILHDVGRSLNPAIDAGQIEGGFVQGMGWLTTEELVFDEAGRLNTHAPSTYKIPACSDRPAVFNLAFWDQENREDTIHRSKAVGEPPLMLAISVFSALTQAVAAAADHKVMPNLDAPSTPETAADGGRGCAPPRGAAYMNWAGAALRRIDDGAALALVTVVSAEGSTPREAGARMLVGEDWLDGTIGGGNLEYLASDQARRLLVQSERDYAVQDFPLGPLLAQCCGGRVRLLLERLGDASRPWLHHIDGAYRRGRTVTLSTEFAVRTLKRFVILDEDQWPGLLSSSPIRLVGREPRIPRALPVTGDRMIERIETRRPAVWLFGAGHVGLAAARQLVALPFDMTHTDIRPEAAAPGVSILTEDAMLALAAAPADFILVMTHSHDLDYRIVKAALTGPGSGYVGLIGSSTKRARFFSRLRTDGVPDAALARLVCPIGIPGLKSKAPEVIAVSVAADLLQRAEALAARGRA